MHDLRKTLGRSAANALRGTVRSYLLGMFLLELLESLEQLVVFSVRNFGIVAQVIEIFVTANLFPQLLYFFSN